MRAISLQMKSNQAEIAKIKLNRNLPPSASLSCAIKPAPKIKNDFESAEESRAKEWKFQQSLVEAATDANKANIFLRKSLCHYQLLKLKSLKLIKLAAENFLAVHFDKNGEFRQIRKKI